MVRVAEEMIAEYGSKALAKTDQPVKALQCETLSSFAKRWELIREIFNDPQEFTD